MDPAATMDKLVNSVTTALDELDPQATAGDVFTDVAAVDSQTGAMDDVPPMDELMEGRKTISLWKGNGMISNESRISKGCVTLEE